MKYGPLSFAMFAATKVLLPMDRDDSDDKPSSYYSGRAVTWGSAFRYGFRFMVAILALFLGIALTIGGTIFLCAIFNTGWCLLAVLPLGVLSFACIAKTWEWSTRP